MNSYADTIEDLSITIKTFQSDPRRDVSHKYHQRWLALINSYQTQLEEAIANSQPSLITSLTERLDYHKKVELLLIRSLAGIIDSEDAVSMIDIFNKMVDSLTTLQHDNEAISSLTNDSYDQLVTYLRTRSQILAMNDDADNADDVMTNIGALIKTLGSLYRVDIKVKDEFDDNEDDSESD